MKINFGNSNRFSQLGNFPVLPEGRFKSEIFYAAERKTKGNEDMLAIGFKTDCGTCFHNVVIPGPDRSEETADLMLMRVSELLRLLGMKHTGKVSLKPEDLLGKTIGISVIHVDYEGTTKPKVHYFYDHTESQKEASEHASTKSNSDAEEFDVSEIPF